jgi:subtilase family protein
MFLCAAPLAVTGPAAASRSRIERAAVRSALTSVARPASGGLARLPLPESPLTATAAPRSAGMGERALLARSRTAGPLLVGLRSHADRAAVVDSLRRLGGRPRALAAIGVLAVDGVSPQRVLAALGSDPRVAFIERDRRLRIADPGDNPDPRHAGLPFTWAYPFVRAGQAIAAAGGGSSRKVAVIDTGVDVLHPDLLGRTTRPFDTIGGGGDVRDFNGHGTFVAGLISAVDGNGIGGKGVAGNTQVIPVRASLNGDFTVADLVTGIDASIGSGADIINLSLAGAGLTMTQARALDFAFLNDVLPVAASGNRGDQGNPIEFPAAAVGGFRGGPGIGLSVAAVRPNLAHPAFSNHNPFVSLAAPGAGLDDCHGVFSTIPQNGKTDWDDGHACPPVFGSVGHARFAYGEGTSFAAPIVAGIAALAWQVAPKLASEQVADVLTRSATQTVPGGDWNELTGAGIVNGQAAANLARVYDTRAPKAKGKARRKGRKRVAVRVKHTPDRTDPGHELAGRVSYALLVSHDGGKSFTFAVSPRRTPFHKRLRLRGRKRLLVVASVCDRNGNCDSKRLGRFKKKPKA